MAILKLSDPQEHPCTPWPASPADCKVPTAKRCKKLHSKQNQQQPQGTALSLLQAWRAVLLYDAAPARNKHAHASVLHQWGVPSQHPNGSNLQQFMPLRHELVLVTQLSGGNVTPA